MLPCCQWHTPARRRRTAVLVSRALHGVEAHLEHALLPEGFYLRVRLVVCQRNATPGGLRFWFASAWPAGKNSARTPLTYKEPSGRGKVRKNFRFQEVAFTVLLTSKVTEWHASDSHFDLAGHIPRDPNGET